MSAAEHWMDWWPRAIECGWSPRELFGINADAPMRRFDCMGLLMSLGPGRLTLVEINPKIATFSTPRGAVQRKHRHLVGSSRAYWRYVWDPAGIRRSYDALST
ncbi:MAG: hypothetical protein HQL92_03550 [Magnetococcales bacterium]|nr:hypothetical protein [Magnetococcales bacterium]